MTGFWIGAALLAVAALALLYRPRLGWRTLAVGLVAVAAAGLLYRAVNNWHPEPQSDAEKQARADIVALQVGARDHPADGMAWLRLGQKYLQYEQYPLAATALGTANRIYGGRNAAALAALAEAKALDGDAGNDAQVAPLFESVLQLEPRNAKALFYTGLQALHEGQLPLARERFGAMLGPDVPAEVQAALQKQLAAIDAEIASGKRRAQADTTTTVSIEVAVAAPLRPAFEAKAKAGATLFVFVRNPAGGPPLAVKRLPPTLPARITLSAADAMVAGNGIQPHQHVAVAARLSDSGRPIASPGDIYGEAQATAGSKQVVTISISQVAR